MNKLVAVVAAALTVAATLSLASEGGDISELFSQGAYVCTKNRGWSFIIVRVWCSFGGVDPNGAESLRRAIAAGIPYHDGYIFPCAGRDAASQVRGALNAMSFDSGSMLWFDIETNPSPGCGWSGDKNSNCQFLREMIQACRAAGRKCGVYSSPYEWETVMGGCTAGADAGLPLWFATYDGEKWGGYHPFGGWSHPAIKQYADSSSIARECGMNADADYYP